MQCSAAVCQRGGGVEATQALCASSCQTQGPEIFQQNCFAKLSMPRSACLLLVGKLLRDGASSIAINNDRFLARFSLNYELCPPPTVATARHLHPSSRCVKRLTGFLDRGTLEDRARAVVWTLRLSTCSRQATGFTFLSHRDLAKRKNVGGFPSPEMLTLCLFRRAWVFATSTSPRTSYRVRVGPRFASTVRAAGLKGICHLE